MLVQSNYMKKPNISQVIFVLYVYSLLSWIFFPLVSITSGELKAREIYVDENSLLVNSIKSTYLYNTDNFDENDIIDSHESIDIFNCKFPFEDITIPCFYFSKYSIQYLHIDPLRGKSFLGEGVFILIPYQNELKEITNEVIGLLIHRLVNKVRWLSKRVIIVLFRVPSNSLPSVNFVSNTFEEWLNLYTSNNLYPDSCSDTFNPNEQQHNYCISPIVAVHIRQAYVLNILDTHNSSYQLDNNFDESLHLNMIGIHGHLPNMDILSSTLFIHDNLPLFVPASNCNYQSMFVSFFVSFTSFYTSQSSTFINYASKLCGIIKFAYSVINTQADGFHHYFLSRRIDSISITPIIDWSHHYLKYNESKWLKKKTNKKLKSNQNSWGNNKFIDFDIITTVMINLIHISSNLHEQLHHSQSIYFLMGTRYFVSLSEFGFPAFFAWLPLVYLFINFFCACVLGYFLEEFSQYNIQKSIKITTVVDHQIQQNVHPINNTLSNQEKMLINVIHSDHDSNTVQSSSGLKLISNNDNNNSISQQNNTLNNIDDSHVNNNSNINNNSSADSHDTHNKNVTESIYNKNQFCVETIYYSLEGTVMFVCCILSLACVHYVVYFIYPDLVISYLTIFIFYLIIIFMIMIGIYFQQVKRLWMNNLHLYEEIDCIKTINGYKSYEIKKILKYDGHLTRFFAFFTIFLLVLIVVNANLTVLNIPLGYVCSHISTIFCYLFVYLVMPRPYILLIFKSLT